MVNVLVVGPQFHGYTRSMAAALQARGHHTTVLEYDLLPGLHGSVVNKALHDLPTAWVPEGWQGAHGRHAVDVLRQVRPDAVLVAKGDMLGDAWWDALDEWGGPSVVWFYDELRRMAYTDGQVNRLRAVVTYSGQDAADLTARGRPAVHVPLAYDAHLSWTARPQEHITFIGARYPQREALLRNIQDHGVSVKAYGRDWSRHPIDIAKSRHWRSPQIPSGRNLTRPEAYGVMAGSIATLNSHGDQDGFTMRTFEASGVGAVQLVDRPDVDQYFIPGDEILVYRDDQELMELAQRAQKDRAWAGRIATNAQKRALAEHTFDHRMATVEELWG